MAFYAAGKDILGIQPPWGALTGVRPVKLPTRAMKQGSTPAQAKEELERHYDVTPVRAQLALDCAKASIAVDESLRPDEVSIYVGIPFCPTRCSYCSFVSSDVHKALKLVSPYLEQVFEEIDATAAALKEAGLKVRSFYMGGGTPTTLTAEQMDALLTRCEQSLPLENCTEFTVEAGRPDTITAEKMAVLKSHGVTRVSVNPQTMEDHVLRAIGRHHTAGDIEKAMELVSAYNFPHVNMDLIAGLPEDTPEGFKRSLDRCLSFGTDNVTVHTLALKKGSRILLEGLSIPGPEAVAEMLDYAEPVLRKNGYAPYYLYRQKYMSGSFENIGWCKPEAECWYNIYIMSELCSILSFGAGGSTKMVEPGTNRIERVFNLKYPKEYTERPEKCLANQEAFAAFYRNLKLK
jgi:oxygen-independent coproporphyrinogen-3 oxidase